MRPLFLLVALLGFASIVRAQTAPPLSTSASLSAQGMFPFVIPPLDDAPNEMDLSYLNDKPAGAHGFVHISGEHFVDGEGKKMRFWGVNLNFEGAFPDQSVAPKIAGRLAKFGFNAVRIHHFDGNASPRGIWKVAAIGSTRLKIPREVDADQLARLDFFVSELIKRGIYVDFNLHVARKVMDGEGVANAALLPEKDKGMSTIDAGFQKANIEFARFLLNHVNPNTGRAYKEEPGICAFEVDNESSLLSIWLDGSLSKLPNPYSENLRLTWNAWLLNKYGSEASIGRAWTEMDTPLNGSDLLNPPVAAVVPAPNPTPVPVDKGAPTILGQPQVLPDTTGAPTFLGAPQPPLPPAPTDPVTGAPITVVPPPMVPVPIVPAATAPVIPPEIPAGIDRWKLNMVGGAAGTAMRDDLGGPSVDGFVQPGLSLNLTRAGNVSWAFQIVRDGLTMDDSKPYTLTFWARADTPRSVSVNLWQDTAPYKWLGYTGAVNVTTDWQQFRLTMRSTGADAGHVRLSFNVSNIVGNLQFGGFNLRAGGRIAVPDSWNIRNGIPLPDAKSEPIFAVRRDFALFLGELEAKNLTAMRTFLINEMGVKVPIWHTQAQFGGWGGQRREMLSDVIDAHIYWKHPDFGGAGWNGSNWRIENSSMAANPLGDPLAATAMLRVPGKPFVVSEFNSGQPNDFGAESLPMLAAFASWQDWAGAWIFDYHSSGAFDRDKFEGFFSIDTQPVKMGTAPLAALLFRRPNGGDLGDVAPAQNEVTLNLPNEMAWSEVANTPGVVAIAPFLKTWSAAGAPKGVALNGRAATTAGAGLFTTSSLAFNNGSSVFDSQQLSWDGVNGLWQVKSPRSLVTAGFVGGRKIDMEGAQFWVAPSSNWATLAVSALDDATIPDSKKLLVTLAGKAENVGMTWNADRTSVGDGWGNGPTYISGITATVKVFTNGQSARIWALDEHGVKRGQLAGTLQNGVIKFQVSPVWRTMWYEIEIL